MPEPNIEQIRRRQRANSRETMGNMTRSLQIYMEIPRLKSIHFKVHWTTQCEIYSCCFLLLWILCSKQEQRHRNHSRQQEPPRRVSSFIINKSHMF